MLQELSKDDRALKDIHQMQDAMRSAVAALLSEEQLQRLRERLPTDDDADKASRYGSAFLMAVHWVTIQLCGAAAQVQDHEAPRAVFRKLSALVREFQGLSSEMTDVTGLH